MILLVGTKNFPENKHFLPPDPHTYACVSGVRNVSFSESFAYVLNKWLNLIEQK